MLYILTPKGTKIIPNGRPLLSFFSKFLQVLPGSGDRNADPILGQVPVPMTHCPHDPW